MGFGIPDWVWQPVARKAWEVAVKGQNPYVLIKHNGHVYLARWENPGLAAGKHYEIVPGSRENGWADVDVSTVGKEVRVTYVLKDNDVFTGGNALPVDQLRAPNGLKVKVF